MEAATMFSTVIMAGADQSIDRVVNDSTLINTSWRLNPSGCSTYLLESCWRQRSCATDSELLRLHSFPAACKHRITSNVAGAFLYT